MKVSWTVIASGIRQAAQPAVRAGGRLAKSWIGEYLLIAKIWTGAFPEKTRKLPLSPIERLVMIVLVFIRSLSLVRVKDAFENKMVRSGISEFYVAVWLGILTVLLWAPFLSGLLLVIVVSYRVVDGFGYRLCILFVDRYQEKWGLRSLNRTLVLLTMNYVELITAFAVLYQSTGSVGGADGSAIEAPLSALYFSLVTVTTLGFGDIRPLNEVGQWLVISETLFGFLFVVLVLAAFITGMGDIRELDRESGGS